MINLIFPFAGFFIYYIFFSFSDSDYQNIDFFINDFIDQPVSSCTKLDFVMIFKVRKPATFYMGGG